MGDVWGAGTVLILWVFIIMAIPCGFTAFLGCRMINKLAYYPSKGPAIQMSIFLWLVIVEVVSFAMLLIFYNVFIDYDAGDNQKGVKSYECRDAYIAVLYPYRHRDGGDHIFSA